MGKPSETLVEDVRAYILNCDGAVPAISDLVGRWDAVPDALRRDVMLYAYLDASETDPLAWDGCRALLRAFVERGDPIPEYLRVWSLAVAAGECPRPKRGKGNPGHTDRADRIRHMYAYLSAQGLDGEEVEATIIKALNELMDDSNAGKLVRKAREQFRQQIAD